MSTNALVPTREDVLVQSHEALRVGSKSFSLASRFLPADRRDDAAVVYAFCRLVDDLADESTDPESASAALHDVRAELYGDRPRRAIINRLGEVLGDSAHGVTPAFHLLDGVVSDLGVVRLETDGDLIRYGYRVAGTVGLMMCGVLGVRDREAYRHAIDLGVAMQITNICRDVAADAELGRVYLPEERLRTHGLSSSALLAGHCDGDKLAPVIRELLQLAESYYASGVAGLAYIPPRSRVAIAVAARIYRAIGRRLLRRGADPLRGRTVVPLWEKLVCASAAVMETGWRALRSRRSTLAHDALLHEALVGLPGADTRSLPVS